MSKEKTENSPYIFVEESNVQEVSTKTILVEIKQVWREEMHLATGDHNIVKREEKRISRLQKKRTNMNVSQLHQTFKPRKNLVNRLFCWNRV